MFSSIKSVRNSFLSYILENGITPINSCIILFPFIRFLENIYDILSEFKIISDIVDNNMFWEKEETRHRIVEQYGSIARMSTKVIFNSLENMNYFSQAGLTDASCSTAIIPNWYKLPHEFILKSDANCQNAGVEKKFLIAYSGNMNDRVDWKLLSDIANLSPDIQLLLIGNASRANEKFFTLLETDNVAYLGPLTELQTLDVLQKCDLAIVPHVKNSISNYMNPLKIHMYYCLRLPIVTLDLPGIDKNLGLVLAKNTNDFIKQVDYYLMQFKSKQLLRDTRFVAMSSVYEYETQYTTLISKVMNA